jgi:hypothetical protein
VDTSTELYGAQRQVVNTVRPIKAHPDLPDRPTELRVWREGLGFDGQKCVPKGVISAPRHGLRRLCNRLEADS